MILIAASTKDLASLNIAKQILENYPFKSVGEKFQGAKGYTAEISDRKVELVILDEELVYAQDITELCSSLELVVFIS
ncbi:MAG: hypothetical protein QXH37_05820, partial [Candidatus Bathyarchaeia archaeon]